MTDLRAYARTAAERNDVPADMFVRQTQQESGFNPDAHNAGSGADGIAQIVPRWHPTMAGKTRDPLASLDYAAELMAGHYRSFGSWRKALVAYNWGPGNLAGWDGRRETLPAETRHYLDVILGDGWTEPNVAEVQKTADFPPPSMLAFDPNTPAELQVQDWTCAIRSTMWLLKSIGIPVTPAEAQDAMSPRYVTPDDGLLNADGSGIVAVLRDRWGVDAVNYSSVTFDQVKEWAGSRPVAIGGRNWGGPNKGHWSAVRGVSATGALDLANPATGAVYGNQTLDREQWAWRGPFSAVAVLLPAAAEPAPAVDELADVRRRLNEAVSALGYVSGDVAQAADAVASAATALANTLRSLGPPAA